MPTVALTATNDGHNLFRDGASGANNPKVTYFALGTGTSTPTAGQHHLDNETFRKAVTNFTNGGAVGEVLINCFLGPGDYVGGDIEEVAVFGGNAASSAANSGVMLGRALWAHNPKGASESIQLQLDLTT